MLANALLVSIIASAVGLASASASLSLRLSAPAYVHYVQDLKVVATLANVGQDKVLVLNAPQSPLSKMATNTFNIINQEGQRPSFAGFSVTYVPEMAALAGAYTVIEPGQSVEVEHDLSAAYDFSSSGGGNYHIYAKDVFHVVNPENPEDITLVHSSSFPVQVNIFQTTPRNITSAGDETVHTSAKFRFCSASHIKAINSAAPAARKMAETAFRSLSLPLTQRYRKWFGPSNNLDARYLLVRQHFDVIRRNQFSSFTYDCSGTCMSGTYAYVEPQKFGIVYLCTEFWKAPLRGINSKAGTLVHEASHFTRNGGTYDYVYGFGESRKIARSNPDRAVMNADNYKYYAENA